MAIMFSCLNMSSGLQVISNGAHFCRSASFQLVGIVRDRQLHYLAGPNRVLGEGFLRSVYYRQAVLAPIVTGIVPDSGVNTGRVEITALTGANFLPGAAVKLSQAGQPGLTAVNVTVVSPGKLTCSFDLTGAAAGRWDVTVTNPDGRSGTLPAAFKVSYAAPVVNSIRPNKGSNNNRISTVITGLNLKNGASAKLSKSGESDLPGEGVVVYPPASLACVFDLTGKAIGNWDVSVTNSDGQSGTLAAAFRIEASELEIIGPVIFQSYTQPELPGVNGTKIGYTLSKDADLTINLYNIRGERIWSQTFLAGTSGGQFGPNTVRWNGLTAYNTIAGAGVYIVYFSGQVGGKEKILAKEKLGIVR